MSDNSRLIIDGDGDLFLVVPANRKQLSKARYTRRVAKPGGGYRYFYDEPKGRKPGKKPARFDERRRAKRATIASGGRLKHVKRVFANLNQAALEDDTGDGASLVAWTVNSGKGADRGKVVVTGDHRHSLAGKLKTGKVPKKTRDRIVAKMRGAGYDTKWTPDISSAIGYRATISDMGYNRSPASGRIQPTPGLPHPDPKGLASRESANTPVPGPKLSKARYTRRVAKPGGGYRYFYDEPKGRKPARSKPDDRAKPVTVGSGKRFKSVKRVAKILLHASLHDEESGADGFAWTVNSGKGADRGKVVVTAAHRRSLTGKLKTGKIPKETRARIVAKMLANGLEAKWNPDSSVTIRDMGYNRDAAGSPVPTAGLPHPDPRGLETPENYATPVPGPKTKKSAPSVPRLRARHPANAWGHRDGLRPGDQLPLRKSSGVVTVGDNGSFIFGGDTYPNGNRLLQALTGQTQHRTTIRRYFRLSDNDGKIAKALASALRIHRPALQASGYRGHIRIVDNGREKTLTAHEVRQLLGSA